MSYSTWIKGKDLRSWADEVVARQKLPALIRKLIHATIHKPRLVQFPADEGVQRRGWDGILEVLDGNPWIPAGQSVWEMGVDQNPRHKANQDYDKRTGNPGSLDTYKTTFVFVTLRKWEGKADWLDEKRKQQKWLNVLAWDCDDLEQWLETAPAVDAWLARLLGKCPYGVLDLSSSWGSLAATTDPPLTPAVVLAGRTKTGRELHQALSEKPGEIGVSAISLPELHIFASALFGSHAEEDDPLFSSKALVVESTDAWKHLSVQKYNLLLIPGDSLPLDATMVSEAVRCGHHVLVQRPYSVDRGAPGIRLPRADRWLLQEALERAGFPEDRAARLARESGGCLSVLVRLASKFKGQASLDWSRPPEAIPLLPLALLGAWSDQNQADQKLLERITGEPYSTIQQLAIRWLNPPDGPLRLSNGTYEFVSREESWLLLSPYFTSDHFSRFGGIALEVLGEDDPRFDLPAGERYLAGIHGKLPKYSSAIREGIATTIALLGTHGETTPQGGHEGSCWRAGRLVCQLLQNAPPRRWFSIAYDLPLLAEAAPDEFLSAVENDLQQPSPSLAALFEKDADGFFSSSPHTKLMWALSLLVWDSTYFSRVVFALAGLIKLDAGGCINPRPAGLLEDIFRFWYPQSSATVAERLQVLGLLLKRDPEIAWSLLLALVAHQDRAATPISKPRWRDYDAPKPNRLSQNEILRQTVWAASSLLSVAESNPDKWPPFLEHFSDLPPNIQTDALDKLRAVDLSITPLPLQHAIWNILRDTVQKHRFSRDVWWALPDAMLDNLADLSARFTPSDPIARSQWLFGSDTFHAFGTKDTPYEECEKLLITAQEQAVRDVFGELGLEGLFKLARKSPSHYSARIGGCLARSGLLPDYQAVLPEKLLSSAEHERGIALGYAASRYSLESDSWIAGLPLEDWRSEAVGIFACALPFNQTTWQMLRRRKPEAESFYWQRVRPWSRKLSDEELEEAIRALLKYGRTVVAVEELSAAIHNHRKPSWKTIADTLDAATSFQNDNLEGTTNSMFIWSICELMEHLQLDSSVDQGRLVALEWRLLPLARHDHFRPRNLHLELSRNPSFFADVLAAVYRSGNDAKPDNPDSGKQTLAKAAFELLDSWTSIPGAQPGEQLASSTILAWIKDARMLCGQDGRIEVCDITIGEQLACAPSDLDVSWPCQAVRDVLEFVSGDDILRGFETGVLNQRGVTTRALDEGGEQERELVKKYRASADQFKFTYPRTALALRRIADHYEGVARWEDARADARFY